MTLFGERQREERTTLPQMVVDGASQMSYTGGARLIRAQNHGSCGGVVDVPVEGLGGGFLVCLFGGDLGQRLLGLFGGISSDGCGVE